MQTLLVPQTDSYDRARAEARWQKITGGEGGSGAPSAQKEALQRALAAAPVIDKFPIVLGSNITFAYIAAQLRNALTGYRQQYVDVLDELLDLEPHGLAVLQKRILAVAGARIEVVRAKVPDSEKDRAEEVKLLVENQLESIPYRTRHFASLLWALFYGIAASEVLWKRADGEWRIRELSFIHSRRLSYPVFGEWDLHVWDQGQVTAPGVDTPTQGLYGLRVRDYPNKFVVHAPQLRANYPTREGLGRVLCTYFALKRLILRVSAQDFERFVKPWVVVYYSVTDEETKKPRAALDEEIVLADRAAKGLGAGSLAGAVLPESLRVELIKAASDLSQEKFLDYLDSGITTLVYGQTFTTRPGKFGNKGSQDTSKEDTRELFRWDALEWGDTLREGLAVPIVRLNKPGHDKFVPGIKVHLDRPSALEIIGIAKQLADENVPVDGRAVAEQAGYKLVEGLDPTAPIRMRPIKPTPVDGAEDDGDGGEDEDTGKDEEEDVEPDDERDEGEEAPEGDLDTEASKKRTKKNPKGSTATAAKNKRAPE